MGKQNRRKKAEKKAQKRGQQGRERANDVVDNDDQRGDNGDERAMTIEVGDRVWCNHQGYPSEWSRGIGWSRGVVKAMDDSSYTISRVEMEDREDMYVVVPCWCVQRDTYEWILRFRMGERVLCYSGRWVAATVIQLWPDPRKGCYHCRENTLSVIDTGEDHLVPEDSDKYIMKHPLKFRHSKGDEVIFSSAKAAGITNTSLEPWIRGKITRVDIVGLRDHYAVYECSFMDRNKPKKCFILKDDDEHVASSNASPRQRLLEAIEQDCAYQHIDFLVKSNDMDVNAFRDLLVAKAIESGSYRALLWLQENASVDLQGIRDAEGNGLLHQIAKSPHAERFIHWAAKKEFSKSDVPCLIELDALRSEKQERLIRQKNNQGRSWLRVLVASGNSRALGLALSPTVGLVWKFSSWLRDEGISIRAATRDKDGVSLMGAARRLGQYEMEKMIDEFAEWDMLCKLSGELESAKFKFTRKKATSSLARRLIRFCRRWGRFRPSSNLTIESILNTLCLHGDVAALSWLVDEDQSLLNAQSKMKVTRVNRNEFAQLDLYDPNDLDEQEEELNLVSLAALGKSSFNSVGYLKETGASDAFGRYADMLADYAARLQKSEEYTRKEHDLVSFIKGQIRTCSADNAFVTVLKYKICLLQDDESLENRLKVLDYLVKDEGQAPPNALDAIRWRQSGVLRWLVERAFVDLHRAVCTNPDLVHCGTNMVFLGQGGKIPPSMTVGVFLCLAAIEFDDFQSLQWLVNVHEIPLTVIRLDGWNPVHYCAFFGRSEIFLWLRSENVLQSLIEEMCTREPWDGLYAAHVAVKRGFTFLAGLLLDSGCPSHDSEGKSIYYHAKNSDLEFVREWGKVHEKPMRLEEDIQKLLLLLSSKSVDDMKGHICATGCMDAKRWIECDYLANKSGPLGGKTYLEVLDECCKVADPDFMVWLCRELSPSSRHDFSEKAYQWDLLFGSEAVSGYREKANRLDVSALKSFAAERKGEVLLRRCLKKAWTQDICCSDPSEENVVLGRLLRNSRENAVSTALGLFRDQLLRLDALRNIQLASLRELERLFARGAQSEEISETIELTIEVATEQAGQEGRDLQSYFEKKCILSSDGRINLDCVLPCKYNKEHDLRGMVEWYDKSAVEVSCLYAVLVIECYDELISWSRARERSTWDAKKETAAVRIAAYLGHMSVVDIFLRERIHEESLSSKASRFYAAILGAAEAGKVSDLALYLHECKNLDLPSDPIVNDFETIPFGIESEVRRRNTVASSLVGCVIFGCLYGGAHGGARLDLQASEGPIDNGHRDVLKLVVSNSLADVGSLVRAVAFVLRDLFKTFSYERCIDLLLYLITDLDLDVLRCQEDVNRISEQFVHYMISEAGRKKGTDLSRLQALFKGWLNFVSDLGFDIQSLKYDSFGNKRRKALASILASRQAEQLRTWSQFNLIKENKSFDEIKRAIQYGDIRLTVRYEDGLLFTHLAAAYDRLDVLQWLVEEKEMSLDSCDALGRTVGKVAEISNAPAIIEWISRERAKMVISIFASSHFRGRHVLKQWTRLRRCVRTIQAWQRGKAVRRVYRGRLASRLEDRQRFHEIWDRSISTLASTSSWNPNFSWMAIKQQEHDIVRAEDVVDDMDMFSETTQKLGEAAANVLTAAAQSDEHLGGVDPEEDGVDAGQNSEYAEEQTSSQEWQSVGNLVLIKFTSDVVKWLRRGDSKYREFFVRRIEQLASGQRSRILNKRLTGCKTTIYETYLEQKSGHRILWTEGKDQSLLIWYVAKHKDVSRLIGLIDDAESRSSRQLTSATVLSDIGESAGESLDDENAETERILLDPLGDTPLKLYEVRPDEIKKLSDPTWKPRLYLTTREREVVETSGTVLLLGRSGTGKTCVICNRMDYDRQRAGADPGFSQLFVARSKGLCDYVKGAVDMVNSGEEDESPKSMRFETFSQVIGSLESQLPLVGNTADLFLPSRKMGFGRFKREVYRSDSSGGLDALIIWTNIRSFIKGSIEALQCRDGVLTEEEYLGLGKRRCRLSLEQRQCVYAMFERYDNYMEATGLWDDCDRITDLARRLEYARESDPDAYQGARFSKLYVDEVQDYTQAEIAVFFYMCGPGDLFLAGDPAQSVVEGVEFRFEEIRSVGYRLYGEKRRHLIPDKPKTVHLNFRSHCGILNVAAAVLSCLFEVFPDSAKQLKEDRGLFHGPRPGVFHKVEVARLQELVTKRKGIVLLTHDHDVSRWKRSLDYPLVYGIREAKGLEFQEVILVDFFDGVPHSLQKPWRNLLLGRDVADISRRPEVEGHLKLLYTAITRCIQRLFFAETSSSIAGDAFVRWLTTTTTTTLSTSKSRAGKEALAVKSSVDNVEKMVRTPDEWRSAGLDNAMMAESSEDLSESESWLEKAIYCFEQVGDTVLVSKARTHRSGVRFRLNLEGIVGSDSETMDVAQTELDASLLTEELLAEKLLFEAKEVCCSILPLLNVSYRDMLQEGLISRLPGMDDVDLSCR